MFKLRFGLEKELFLMKDQKIQVVPPYISHDECGLLVEIRGIPCDNIVDAVYSLKAEEYKINKGIKKQGFVLDDSPFKTVPDQIKNEVNRRYAKGLVSHENLYGWETHNNKQDEQTAGVHISFTDPETEEFIVLGRNKKDQVVTKTWFRLFDYTKIFHALDYAFEREIKQAKRNPGFYEIKQDRRIEYRSLPSNVNLDKVIEVISDVDKFYGEWKTTKNKRTK